MIWGLYNTVRSCLCPWTDVSTFKESFDSFSNLQITELDCIDKCVEAARNALPPSVFDLSEASQQMIDSQFNDFETALREASDLTASDRGSLNAKFRRRVGEVIAEKWTEHMAKSFDPIASISDHNDKASAALKWADCYFHGLTYLTNCESEFNTGISAACVATHASMTVIALNAHCHAEIQRRMETMHRQFEKNPAGFEKRMQGLKVKVDGEAEAVPIVDKEIEQLANDCAQGLVMHWPEIDEKKAFLQKCIWTKFSFRAFGLRDAEKLFTATLKAKSS